VNRPSVRLRADQQLFLSYLVLISILTLIMSVGADSLLRPRLLATMEDDLRRELLLARAIFDTSPATSPDSLARMIERLTGRRVTIVAPDGRAIGAQGPPPAESAVLSGDYRSRPEVRAAFSVGEGQAIRQSAASRTGHLYLAVLSERGAVVRFDVPLTEIDSALIAVERRVFAAGAAAVLIAAFFSFGFSLLVTRPLRHIGNVARALAAGDLSRRVRMHRDDDLGDLGGALDKLADELQRRLGQLEGERAEMQALIDSMSEGVLAFSPDGSLRRSNPAARRIFSLAGRPEGIPPEVVSRRPDFLSLVSSALEGKSVPPRELGGDGRPLLATAHPLPHGGAVLVFLDISELRRLEGIRRDFVANASHELKTPLTAIRGFSETLLDPTLPPELTRRFAEIVKQNADRLQQIVDDLLDLSRIEAGGWRVEPSVISIAELAREAWLLQIEGNSPRGVELVLQIQEGHDRVQADAGAVRQIFSNLFSNAVRYTQPGNTVTLRTAEARQPGTPADPRPRDSADRWTEIEVIDSGSGIPAPHLSRIFERFYRADPARSREEGGTGLGLAIVKHLVEAHGGWIEAESQVGIGTTIRFVLPTAD
jgi:two-component system, OmpR family, phosphate regulon sensor histidine kinase PhoR